MQTVVPTLQLQPVNRLFPNRLVPNLNPNLSRTIEAEIVDVAEEVITTQFSHSTFIEAVWNAASNVFPRENIEKPSIRVSHVIKGRTPEAIHKNVRELLDEDKTIYYERMMFCFEIPSICEDIRGNRLNLTIGGVMAYNHENLYSKKGLEKFIGVKGYGGRRTVQQCSSLVPRLQYGKAPI